MKQQITNKDSDIHKITKALQMKKNEQKYIEFASEEMIKCYKKATEKDDADSQLRLVNSYYDGIEVEKDHKKAFE